MKIFWSWQSDRDPATGKYFVRDALKLAAQAIGEELDLTEAERLEVDHDTKGVPGTPPIVDTIYNKIEEAAIFVADVTPVGRGGDGKKLLPNPNVMIELGYARRARGYERLILVANEQFLSRVEDLPFDMRGDRGPVLFTLAADAGKDTRNAVQRSLVDQLKPRLKACIDFEQRQRAALALQAISGQPDSRTKWFDDGAQLDYIDAYQPKAAASVRIPTGPHAFMRIQPAHWPEGIRTTSLAPNENGASLMVGRGSIGNWGQTEQGMLSFRFDGQQDSREVIEADTLVHWFTDTGVVWAVWSDIVSDNTPPWFYGDVVMRHWGRLLQAAVAATLKKGGKAPFRVDAGVVGIKGTRWAMPDVQGALYAASAEIRRSTVDVTAETATQHRYLASLYNRLTDAFGIEAEIPPSQVPSILRGE